MVTGMVAGRGGAVGATIARRPGSASLELSVGITAAVPYTPIHSRYVLQLYSCRAVANVQ